VTGLDVAATQGPMALAALAGLVGVLWARRRRPTDLATWSALAAVAVDSLAMDVHRFRHVWVLLGLADANRRDPEGGGQPPSTAQSRAHAVRSTRTASAP
jgi:MYXO-CTERM domain-containing protein